MHDLITVIIPVYNQEMYLKECLESVINQTYKNIEILVINDGSTDNSLNILKEYEKKDNRIVLISQENQGVYKTRCNGIKSAKGKYITFLDSDDFLDLKFIEILYLYAKKDVDMIRCNFKYYKNNKEFNNFSKLENGLFFKNQFEEKIYKYIYTSFDLNSVCMQLVKKEIALKATEIKYDLKYGEDLIFNCLMIDNTNSIQIISDGLYFYRMNDSSYSHKKSYDVIINRINDILKYTEILNDNIKKWKIINKKKFESYLAFLVFKNILYQLILIDDKDEYYKIMNYIYKNQILKKYLKITPKVGKGLKDFLMLHLVKNIINKRKRLIYIELFIMKKIMK